MLSPDKCFELVNALNAPIGKGMQIHIRIIISTHRLLSYMSTFAYFKGAELFAKRRKRSEKWIVDETTAATRCPSGGAAYSTNENDYNNASHGQYISDNNDQVSYIIFHSQFFFYFMFSFEQVKVWPTKIDWTI